MYHYHAHRYIPPLPNNRNQLVTHQQAVHTPRPLLHLQDVALGQQSDPQANSTLSPEAYCRAALPGTCSQKLTFLVNTRVDMAWGSQVQYPKLNQGLLLNSKVGSLTGWAVVDIWSVWVSTEALHCLACPGACTAVGMWIMHI
jgi:hypothetical protein